MKFTESKLDYAPESLPEDTSGHLGSPFLAIDKYDRHLGKPESKPDGRIFHFDLESIPAHPDSIEVDSLKDPARIADKSGGTVIYLDAKGLAYIYRGEIGNQDTAHGPVYHADTIAVSGTDGEVRPALAGSKDRDGKIPERLWH